MYEFFPMYCTFITIHLSKVKESWFSLKRTPFKHQNMYKTWIDMSGVRPVSLDFRCCTFHTEVSTSHNVGLHLGGRI